MLCWTQYWILWWNGLWWSECKSESLKYNIKFLLLKGNRKYVLHFILMGINVWTLLHVFIIFIWLITKPFGKLLSKCFQETKIPYEIIKKRLKLYQYHESFFLWYNFTHNDQNICFMFCPHHYGCFFSIEFIVKMVSIVFEVGITRNLKLYFVI